MSELEIQSPAKINWFLRLRGRRVDGYHELQTVMQRIELSDGIRLRARADGDIRFSCSPPLDHQGPSLAERAAQILQASRQCRQGVDISLDRRIPVRAGLGGASSNAASVLLGLNRLWSLGLRNDLLAQIAHRLSSDAPFFIASSCAWVEGDGGRVYPREGERRALLLFVSPDGFATASRYQHPGLNRLQPPLDRRDYEKRSPCSLVDLGNPFEDLAREHDAPIRAVVDIASRYGRAFMTGSGATIVSAIARNEESGLDDLAARAQADLARVEEVSEWRVIKTRT